MSHSYYRNPRGRMIKMGIMFASLCFSAYMLPRTIDKLGESGLGAMLQPGGGIGADAQRLLGEGGLDSLLGAEKSSTGKSGAPIVITPNGEQSGPEYQRLVKQAKQMAPIKVVKAKEEKEKRGAGPDPDKTAGAGALAGGEGDLAAVNKLLELLEAEKKKGG